MDHAPGGIKFRVKGQNMPVQLCLTPSRFGQRLQHLLDFLRAADTQKPQLLGSPVAIGIPPCLPGNDDIASPVLPLLAINLPKGIRWITSNGRRPSANKGNGPFVSDHIDGLERISVGEERHGQQSKTDQDKRNSEQGEGYVFRLMPGTDHPENCERCPRNRKQERPGRYCGKESWDRHSHPRDALARIKFTVHHGLEFPRNGVVPLDHGHAGRTEHGTAGTRRPEP